VKQGVRASGWLLVASFAVLAAMFWPQSLGGSIAYVRVDGHSMNPTLHTGDLAVVRKQSSYRVGDPVAYRIPRGEFGAGAVVIHRLIGGDGSIGYTTKGDNRTIADDWHPRTADILGRIRYDIPAGGDVVAELSKPLWVGALVGGLTALVMVVPSRSRRRPRIRTARPRHA
jgi:signal peptidase